MHSAAAHNRTTCSILPQGDGCFSFALANRLEVITSLHRFAPPGIPAVSAARTSGDSLTSGAFLFSESVAAQSESSPVDVQGVIEWIEIILPILKSLQCFSALTPEQEQDWIADNPGRARNNAIRQLRAKSTERMRRRDARPIADQMIEQALSMSPEEFAAAFGDD